MLDFDQQALTAKQELEELAGPEHYRIDLKLQVYSAPLSLLGLLAQTVHHWGHYSRF